MTAPLIIPFFIPHQGCPHQCVFCNQQSITGQGAGWLSPEQVGLEISQRLASGVVGQRQVQVAFYGGSFSCLEQDQQRSYLAAVAPYVRQGKVTMVRISTRPDCLAPDRIRFLQDHGVGLVEVGVQSCHGEVLQRSGRGHTLDQVAEAFANLEQAGMPAGGQLMVGLPGDTPVRSLASARQLVHFKVSQVRIYPTVVVAHTPLARLYEQHSFQPWSLAKAVVVCAAMKEIFDQAGGTVIRMGLQDSPGLQNEIVAGPFHPAFGEMVLRHQLFKRLRLLLASRQPSTPAILQLAEQDRSLFVGNRQQCRQQLSRRGLLQGITVTYSADQPRLSGRLCAAVEP